MQTPAARSVAIAIAIGAGSRHERPSERGAAHLLEHLCFRGIQGAETSAALAHAMESLGATSNAGTDRESTMYWIHAPRAAAVDAARLIGAVALAPLLQADHMRIERQIVIEEIRSYDDDPSEQAGTALDRALYGDHALGREIAARPAEVRALGHDAVTRFHARTYVPSAATLAIAGDLTLSGAQAIARAALAALPRRAVARRVSSPRAASAGLAARIVPARGQGIVAKIRDGEQAQFALGLPALRREDPDAPALELLSTILGDGSASRLFLELREDRGLVYDISASSIEYADAGAFIVAGGADPSKVLPAVLLATEALKRLAREAPSDREIERARAYLAGRLERAADDPRGLAEWHASQRLLRRSPQELPDLLREIARVRPADLLRVARRLAKGGGFRVGLSAPRATVSAVRRAAARGDLDPSRPEPRAR
ncbi:MAG: M16 family metallopeptidase [Candidatus Limnocylindrus sp.]